MSSRYRVTVQYDGSEFFGWQSQLNHRTVQGDLEAALAVLNSGNRVVVTGAGRTDTGVHALGQVAHFDLNTQLSESELCRALNGNLKEDVRIRDCEVTDADFNARFSAKRRSYVYTCRTDDYILDRNYVWPVRG